MELGSCHSLAPSALEVSPRPLKSFWAPCVRLTFVCELGGMQQKAAVIVCSVVVPGESYEKVSHGIQDAAEIRDVELRE